MESDPDPFASDGFWRLSKFSVEALQLPWNATLPGAFQWVASNDPGKLTFAPSRHPKIGVEQFTG
jgi:hypothetical protein